MIRKRQDTSESNERYLHSKLARACNFDDRLIPLNEKSPQDLLNILNRGHITRKKLTARTRKLNEARRLIKERIVDVKKIIDDDDRAESSGS